MRTLAAVGRGVTRWYIASLILIAAGVVVGYFFFFNAFPGRPQVAIIDIPFTVINEDSAFFIGKMLDYARTADSIKAVVIKLDSPGGFSVESEELFLKTLKLREKKPVVISTGFVLASGGYLMSMGSNYIYTKSSSYVGSVGARVGPIVEPPPPNEREIASGPSKLTGFSYNNFVENTERSKEAFVQTVFAQRGDRLQISPQELAEARLYQGMEAVRLGLVDGIGSETDATEKSASLAGISNYELVDVNEMVLREFVVQLRRIFASEDGEEPQEVDLSDIHRLRTIFSTPQEQEGEDRAPPHFPFDITLPKMQY